MFDMTGFEAVLNETVCISGKQSPDQACCVRLASDLQFD